MLRALWKTKFDGDTSSYIAFTSQEAINEVNKALGDVSAFINAKGEFRASCNVDTVAWVVKTFSGDYD